MHRNRRELKLKQTGFSLERIVFCCCCCCCCFVFCLLYLYQVPPRVTTVLSLSAVTPDRNKVVRQKVSTTKAMFTLSQIAQFALPRKPYRIELLITHKNGDFRANFVTERSYAAPFSKWRVKHRTDMFPYCCGGVCGRVVNTSWSDSGSGGPEFKPRPSRCFLGQGTSLHFASLHPGV